MPKLKSTERILKRNVCDDKSLGLSTHNPFPVAEIVLLRLACGLE